MLYMLKIITSTSSQEFPHSFMFSYLFYSSCFPELPYYVCFINTELDECMAVEDN